eukprot:PITA_11397
MLGYDFEIIYKKWKKNVVADALSRKDEDAEAFLYAISIIQPDWINEARNELKNDEEVWALIQKLQQDPSTSNTLAGKMICYGTKIAYTSTQWVKWLPLSEWWYNDSFHTITKMAPFMELYGYHLPSITSYLSENSKVQAVEDHIKHQQQVLQLLKDKLTFSQNRMKQQEDQHRSERSFDVGHRVFLQLQP